LKSSVPGFFENSSGDTLRNGSSPERTDRGEMTAIDG
jgi:hypothetical protein